MDKDVAHELAAVKARLEAVEAFIHNLIAAEAQPAEPAKEGA